ncbi:uncharacterized protein MELLADRAFT_92563 [Melampsora larici-populina 98AG31]|uniref:Uncharacterized protein n=1 Tax=Melampsora larici-populina (strain 98AG31 / pathotype 3-4-7) TaxID=747676 RepID=F4S202_MELLP|nr:uncharacterized protein MELLADRAFT_92563 [Melampsora larici-populina 98AG31]EGG01349.1 hypothetical protein MELLADRAFT_92563 [Melampsora larici-populina 98AG31]
MFMGSPLHFARHDVTDPLFYVDEYGADCHGGTLRVCFGEDSAIAGMTSDAQICDYRRQIYTFTMPSFSKLRLMPKLAPGVLPPEVISRIMMYYMDTAPWKTTNAINSAEERVLIIRTTIYLQRLRLVAWVWAQVIPYFLFDAVRLQTHGMAHRLLERWQGSILSSQHSPLRCLSMEHLWGYTPAEPEIHIPDSVMKQCAMSIPMYTGAKVIHTFGINITSLTLVFGNCMMVSPDMIEAVKYIKCLGKLTLIRRYDWPRRLSTDSESIAQLLCVTPTLESLSVSLPYLDPHFLHNGSLPCLRHFWFKYYESSRQALSQITRATTRTLNTIEYNSVDPANDRPAGILWESQFNLECLCIDNIPTNLPPATSFSIFPKLRCLRTTTWPSTDFHLGWLQRGFFRSLRTLVTKYTDGQVYWRHALCLLPDGHFQKPVHFKHIVFTNVRGASLVDDEAQV